MNQIDYYQAKLDFEIDSAELFNALAVDDGRIVVVDTRSALAYDIEHIHGAINLPHRSLSGEVIRQLDSNMFYVCYCDGVGSNVSTKGAFALATGEVEVVVLMGGLEGWNRDGYPTEGRMERSEPRASVAVDRYRDDDVRDVNSRC